MNDTPGTIWTQQIYAASRRKYSATLSADTDIDALIAKLLEFEEKAAAAGLLVDEPGLEPGENKELIVTVMRREKPADGTPIIDFYPAWSAAGGDEPFGTYKYLHIYLNLENPQLTADFLAASGFKSLNDIPLYDGQSPLKRTKGRVHPKETAVPTPFFVVKKQGDEKIGSDGQPYRPWEFVRYERNDGTSRPTPPQPTTTGQPIPGDPQTSANGNGHDAPATPKAPDQLMPPDEDPNVLRSNWVIPHETKDKTVYYEVEGGATTYSRELFRKVGYTEQDLATWPIEIGRKIMLLAPLDVYYKTVKSNGREFKQIVKIEKIAQEQF